jgi:hypothetical protein
MCWSLLLRYGWIVAKTMSFPFLRRPSHISLLREAVNHLPLKRLFFFFLHIPTTLDIVSEFHRSSEVHSWVPDQEFLLWGWGRVAQSERVPSWHQEALRGVKGQISGSELYSPQL